MLNNYINSQNITYQCFQLVAFMIGDEIEWNKIMFW